MVSPASHRGPLGPGAEVVPWAEYAAQQHNNGVPGQHYTRYGLASCYYKQCLWDGGSVKREPVSLHIHPYIIPVDRAG